MTIQYTYILCSICVVLVLSCDSLHCLNWTSHATANAPNPIEDHRTMFLPAHFTLRNWFQFSSLLSSLYRCLRLFVLFMFASALRNGPIALNWILQKVNERLPQIAHRCNLNTDVDKSKRNVLENCCRRGSYTQALTVHVCCSPSPLHIRLFYMPTDSFSFLHWQNVHKK